MNFKPTHLPIPAQPTLFEVAPPTVFAQFIETTLQLVDHEPAILDLVQADLDRLAIEKKTDRLRDDYWVPDCQEKLPGQESQDDVVNPGTPRLQIGRPRMNAKTCYLFWMIRAYAGGIKSVTAKDLILESKSVQIFLSAEGVSMPGMSTIIDNTNAISLETQEAILDAQLRQILGENLDDFKNLMVDSTAVVANTVWPTDSGLMLDLVQRLFKRSQKLDLFDLKPMPVGKTLEVIKELKALDFQIANCTKRKGAAEKRNALYEDFLDLAEVASQTFAMFLQELDERVACVQLVPTQKDKLKRLYQWMCEGVANLDKVIGYCTLRIKEGQSTPSTEKVLSLSDPDAAWIEKGDREPVVGYKPQIGKSANGFVTAIIVPQGNAADVAQLTELCEQAINRVGVIPDLVNCDGGYASTANRKELQATGVGKVSFSSSKGKAIIPEEEWESEPLKLARRMRSAVESLMFQLKHAVNFGEVMRRGLEKVRQELLSKAVAFNFLRMEKVVAKMAKMAKVAKVAKVACQP